MKVFQKTISIETKKLYDFVRITDNIQKAVDESKIRQGMVFVNNMHTTTTLIIQENDPTIFKDLIDLFERILPLNEKYEHDYEGNENATAHLKQNLLNSSLSIPLKDGKLILGTWQDIFFVELFKPRDREVVVTIMGE